MAGGKGDLSPTAQREKRLKDSRKEGYRKGVDLCGASELGGTEFFVTTIQGADGDIEALHAALTELLNEVKTIGVILVSAGVHAVSAYCSVPASKAEEVPASEWLAAAAKGIGATIDGGATNELAKFKYHTKEGEYAIKLKDKFTEDAFTYLRAKGKFRDESDGEEMIFGDDDFGN